MSIRTWSLALAPMAVALVATEARAQERPAAAERALGRRLLVGVQLSGGGRYDNVRLCVASGPGTPGGPAMDGALILDATVGRRVLVRTRVPVLRPLLFGGAFKMLQLEPDVGVLFRIRATASMNVLVGPVAGVTLHYGPDWQTPKDGTRFFALGPKVGAVIALDWPRPGRSFGFQLGLSPYVTLLWGVNDPADHFGEVVGGMAEVTFYF